MHREENATVDDPYDIVDGQQRIISLTLLRTFLDNSFDGGLLSEKFPNKISQDNIHKNYRAIKDWFALKDPVYRKKVIDAFDNVAESDKPKLLEVVVIYVEDVAEAFQLFDSQNTRGRALDPHDLLKAYHLREMRNYPYEMRHAVTKWEAFASKDIRDLFQLYLFPIRQWAKRENSVAFSAKHIDTYKGITENLAYTYAQRAGKAMPVFQIAEPFIAGNDFFEMVDHYLKLKKDVEAEIERSGHFEKISSILNGENGEYKHSAGFKYTKKLFYCAALCYYDRFRNFYPQAIHKLFAWAFMLRVDMQKLGLDSVNKYALGLGKKWKEKDGKEKGEYSNNLAMFWKITNARLHSEIANMPIEVPQQHPKSGNEEWKWNGLLEMLKPEILNAKETENV